MKKLRDILLIVLFAVPVLAAVLTNRLVIVLGNLLGLSALAAGIRIRTSYLPALRKRSGPNCSREAMDARERAVLDAFSQTGYDAKQAEVLRADGRLGIRVPHATARNAASGKPKYALYLEGTDFEIGRFCGMLAAQEVHAMTTTFVNGVVFEFMKERRNTFIGELIADLTYRLARFFDAATPAGITAEIYGVWEGCRLAASGRLPGRAPEQIAAQAPGKTPEQIAAPAPIKLPARAPKRPRPSALQSIYSLNYGIDVIMSFIYAGTDSILKFLGINIKDFSPPVSCNGFSIGGSATDGQHFFGRDFMFPPVDVFGDSACHVVVNRLPDGDSAPDPLLCVRAPGMVGAVTCLNRHGQAMGTDMVCSRNTRWRKLGLNSLLMVRHAVGSAHSVEDLIRSVARAQRGVPWLYPFADRESGRGGTMETGATMRRPNYLRYTPADLRGLLPDRTFVRAHRELRWRRGIMVRELGYRAPDGYMAYNEALFERFGQTYPRDQWGDRGFLVRRPFTAGLPAAFYFAPTRMPHPDISIATNQYQIPEMRLFAMNEWSVQIPSSTHEYADFQWRYDSLNQTILDFLEQGPISEAQARDCVAFLRPYNEDGSKAPNHFYYGVDKTGKSIPPEEIQTFGCSSLVNLTSFSVQSHYGTWADPWVSVDFGAVLRGLSPEKSPQTTKEHA